jgi:hypothetical protein
MKLLLTHLSCLPATHNPHTSGLWNNPCSRLPPQRITRRARPTATSTSNVALPLPRLASFLQRHISRNFRSLHRVPDRTSLPPATTTRASTNG